MRTAAVFGVMVLALGCGGTGAGAQQQQGSGVTPKLDPLPRGSTLLSGTDYSPEPDSYLWLAGRSPNDLWIGSSAGILRRDGAGAPEPVAALAPDVLGGQAAQGIALSTGELLVRVSKADGSSALVAVVGDAVTDRAADFGTDGGGLAARFLGFHRTPDGQAVAVLRSLTPGSVTLETWRNGHFQQTCEFAVPGDPEKARIYPTNPVHGYVLGPDAQGAYVLSRFDNATVTQVLTSQDQLSAPLWPTTADTGFLPLAGLKWFDGHAFVTAHGTDAAASFAFGPDGLASTQLQVHDPRPRVTLVHGPAAGVEIALGEPNQRVLASGLVGRWFIALLQPTQPSDPSLAAVNVDTPPKL